MGHALLRAPGHRPDADLAAEEMGELGAGEAEPCANAEDRGRPYAGGIPGAVRIIYAGQLVWGRSLRIRGIEPGIAYRARFVDPLDGRERPIGLVEPAADGSWLAPILPELRDWLIVLESQA